MQICVGVAYAMWTNPFNLFWSDPDPGLFIVLILTRISCLVNQCGSIRIFGLMLFEDFFNSVI